MTLGEPPATPKLRLIGIVWGVVGVLAIVVGFLAKTSVIMIFGGLALGAGVLVYAAQAYREASAERTQRRIAGSPVPPRNAPAAVPDVGPGAVPSGLEGRPGYRRRPWLRGDPHETSEDPSDDGSTESGTEEADEPSDSTDGSQDGSGDDGYGSSGYSSGGYGSSGYGSGGYGSSGYGTASEGDDGTGADPADQGR